MVTPRREAYYQASGGEGTELDLRQHLLNVDPDLLDGIVPVTEAVPLRRVRLCPAGHDRSDDTSQAPLIPDRLHWSCCI